jgi:hypothetical protein
MVAARLFIGLSNRILLGNQFCTLAYTYGIEAYESPLVQRAS